MALEVSAMVRRYYEYMGALTLVAAALLVVEQQQR